MSLSLLARLWLPFAASAFCTWREEKTKLPKGAPSQKMLGSELAREIAGS